MGEKWQKEGVKILFKIVIQIIFLASIMLNYVVSAYAQGFGINQIINQNTFEKTQEKTQKYVVENCKIKDYKKGKIYSITPIGEVVLQTSKSLVVQNLWFVEMTCLYSKKCVYYVQTGKERDNAIGFTTKVSQQRALQVLVTLNKQCRKY